MLRKSTVVRVVVTTVAMLGLATACTPGDAGGGGTAHRGPLVQVFTEAATFTGDPANALQEGWWGHEGPGHDEGTAFSLDKSTFESSGMGDGTTLGIAFVPMSKDPTKLGSAERPTGVEGRTAGEVFKWFTTVAPVDVWRSEGAGANSVAKVLTKDEFAKWLASGRPQVYFDENLVAHDALATNGPIVANPPGKSVLNRWPAGTKVSLVVFQTTGQFVSSVEPYVAADPDGNAITAWVSFETVASPDRSAETSAGYRLLPTAAPSKQETK